MMIEAPSETYIKAAMSLEESKKKRLLFKMRSDLAHNLEDEPDTIQALAIQLQTEDEELAEWREKLKEIKESENNQNLSLFLK